MAGFKFSGDAGAIVFAILSGLSALFMIAWIFETGGCRDSYGPKITPLPVAAESSVDQKEVSEARKALAGESARRAELANELRESEDDRRSLEEENAILEARLEKLKAAASSDSATEGKLADLRLKLKALESENLSILMKLKDSGEGAREIGILTAELAAIKFKFDAETKASKEANKSLLTLMQSAAEKEKNLLVQIESLKGTMSGDAESGDAESRDLKKVSADLEALKLSFADKAKIASAQLVKLRDEVAALTKKLTLDAKACDAAKKKLISEINKLNGELDSLKNGGKQKRAGDFPDLPIFVNTPLQLKAGVRPLIIDLRGISERAAVREATHKKIIAQGNSNAKNVVSFD